MRKLLRRRVPQIVGAYLATSWVFLEFTSWAVNQYQLSPTLSNFVVTALLLLVPAVALLAWRHGAPGEDRWTKTDAAIIGTVTSQHPGAVQLQNVLGGGRLLDLLSGEQMPRIC